MRNILNPLVLMFSIVLSSCLVAEPDQPKTEFDSEEQLAFESLSDIAIIVEGEALFAHNKMVYQKIYTTDKRQYMITTYDQSEFYSIVMDKEPLLDSTVNVLFSMTGVENTLDKTTIKMIAVKIENNKLWIWNEEKKTGAILEF